MHFECIFPPIYPPLSPRTPPQRIIFPSLSFLLFLLLHPSLLYLRFLMFGNSLLLPAWVQGHSLEYEQPTRRHTRKDN